MLRAKVSEANHMAIEWQGQSAASLGRLIATGDISPVALTQACLDAIASHPHKDEIFARLTPDRALAEAEAATVRARTGNRLGPLDVVPISWKDLFDTAGVASEAGSALLAGRVPTEDALVLKRAALGGSVCLGKTHMSELAFSGLGLNPVTATPPCVNDTVAVSGGSSSGAAVSVAMGLAPLAIGTDTGGSVRIPAAWNDLVGLKTTSGLLPLQGVVPLAARFDTVGPLARTVEDAALALGLLQGQNAPDLRGADLKGCRLMALTTLAMDAIQDAPRAAYQSAVERLQAAGAVVERREAPSVDAAQDLVGPLFAAEAYGTWRDEIERNPQKMYSEILERFRGGRQYSGPGFVAAWQKLEGLRAQYLAETAGFDAVILPTTPILPPNRDRLLSDGDYYVTQNLLALRNTRIGNLMGLAGLTLPTGVPSAGIMFLTQPLTEARLLRLGAAAEEALS